MEEKKGKKEREKQDDAKVRFGIALFFFLASYRRRHREGKKKRKTTAHRHLSLGLHPEARYATRSAFVRGSAETGAEEGGPARGRWRAAVSFLDDDDDNLDDDGGKSDRRRRC